MVVARAVVVVAARRRVVAVEDPPPAQAPSADAAAPTRKLRRLIGIAVVYRITGRAGWQPKPAR